MSPFPLYSNENFKELLIWWNMKQGHCLVSPLNLIVDCPLLPEGLILMAQRQAHSNLVQQTKALHIDMHFSRIIFLSFYFIVKHISCLKWSGRPYSKGMVRYDPFISLYLAGFFWCFLDEYWLNTTAETNKQNEQACTSKKKKKMLFFVCTQLNS